MQTLKDALEKELGTLSKDAINFALTHFKRDMIQVGNKRKLSYSEMMNEMSTLIDFYYRHIHPKEMRKKFIYREITRDGGDIERAYLISRQNIKSIREEYFHGVHISKN